MAGYDLDRYKDIKGAKPMARVLERPKVSMEPIHRELPPEKPGTPKDVPSPNTHVTTAIISSAASAPPEEKEKPAGGANVERTYVIMGRVEPKAKKAFTMSDL